MYCAKESRNTWFVRAVDLVNWSTVAIVAIEIVANCLNPYVQLSQSGQLWWLVMIEVAVASCAYGFGSFHRALIGAEAMH